MTKRMLIVLVVSCGLLVALIAHRGRAAADWLCEYVQALTVYPGVSLAEYVDDQIGWRDTPADLEESQLMLPVSEDMQQFYLIKTSVQEQEQWIWTYRSMTTWTNAQGTNDGHHDFCPAVLVIDQK